MPRPHPGHILRPLVFGVAALLLSGGSLGLRAQQPPPADCPPLLTALVDSLRVGSPGAATAAAGRPDVVIRATARAREVRFEQRPEISVRLTGCAARDTVIVTRRENLPRPVSPGTTYRDVLISVEVLGYLGLQCLAGTGADTTRAAGGAALCPVPGLLGDPPRAPPPPERRP